MTGAAGTASGRPAFPDRRAIEADQIAAVRRMLPVLLPANHFYAAKLAAAGVTAEIAGLDEFFARVPFTTKQELAEDQRAFPPFGTNLTFPLERYTRFSQTSGTSGTPIRWLDTDESWSWMVDNWVEVMRVSEVTPSDRVLFAFSFGPFLGFWTAFEAATRLGALCLPGGGLSSAGRLQTILENGVTVLCCTPTYAVRLGEVAAEHGMDLAASQVRTLIVAGEPGASIPSTRARIEATWPGARLCDHHGMTEIGPVSYECPVRRGVLHVIERGFIAEVIDPRTGAAAAPGERGELVLTNLGRLGSPLIRYRTGDLVQRAGEQQCACGRSELALEGGILGRTDDMVLVRGVNVFPSAVEHVVRGFAEVAEYRVEVQARGALTELAIDLEPVPACPDAARLQHAVAAALRAAFNLRIPVRTAPPGSLPRFELKAKRWIRVDNSSGESRGTTAPGE